MYEAKETMKVIGLEYKKIHACSNDCILYRNKFANLTKCPKHLGGKEKKMAKNKIRKRVSKKMLWYFPPTPSSKDEFNHYKQFKT